MAIIFEGSKPGTLYVINSYFAIPAIISSSLGSVGGVYITGMRLTGSARYRIEYALSGNPYVYVFGSNLSELSLAGLIVSNVNCSSVDGINNFLVWNTLNSIYAYGTPVLTVGLGQSAFFKGFLVNFGIAAHDTIPGVFVFNITLHGVYYAIV